MSTFYSGQSGRLYINDVKAAKVTQWSLTAALSTLDTTSLEDTDRTSTVGLRSTSGTCTLYYYEQDDGSNSCSQLIDSIIKPVTNVGQPGIAAPPDQVSLRLQAGPSRYIQGNAWITGASMTMATGAVLSAQITFEFNGAPLQDTL
jgi:hypothetical protein